MAKYKYKRHLGHEKHIGSENKRCRGLHVGQQYRFVRTGMVDLMRLLQMMMGAGEAMLSATTECRGTVLHFVIRLLFIQNISANINKKLFVEARSCRTQRSVQMLILWPHSRFHPIASILIRIRIAYSVPL